MQERSPGCGVNVESKAPGFLRPKEWHGKKFAGLFCCWQEQWVIANVNHPIKERRYNFNNSLNWLPCCICWFLRIYIELAAKVNHVAFLLCLSFKSNLNGKKKLICASSITYNPGLHGNKSKHLTTHSVDLMATEKPNWHPMVWPPSCKSYY